MRVEDSTSNRLAEAAQLLMDVAREGSKENPTYEPGAPNTEHAISLATQALFYADMWTDAGAHLTLNRPRALAIFRGLGAGVGCALAALGNGLASKECLAVFGEALIAGSKQAERMHRRAGR